MRAATVAFARLSFFAGLVAFCLVAAGGAFAGAEETYKVYANGRFGYSVEYPDIFWSRFEADNGDGIRFTTANGHCELAVWGQHNIDGKSAKELLESSLEQSAHIVPDSPASGKDWYTLTTSDDGGLNGVEHHFLKYGIVNKDTVAVFEFRYPVGKGFERVAERLKKTLQFGRKTMHTLDQFDLHAWAPEYSFDDDDAKVYRIAKDGGKLFAGDAEKVETEMGLYYWFPVSPEAGEVMRGSQSGIYFFYESGRFIAFLPSGAAEFTGEVRISPDAERFLVDFGTSPERALKLYDFRTLKEKRAFLAMAEIAWLDARRFAMTHIDTEKPARAENAVESGWMSVVVYDADKAALTYTREATETSDFMLDGIDREAGKFLIGERSVKSAKDWADESRIERREFSVDFSGKH